MDPQIELRKALVEIEPVLAGHGFKLRHIKGGSRGGIPHATATFVRGRWRATVHYGDRLEPGSYRHAWKELPHMAFVPDGRQRRPLTAVEYAGQIEEYAGVVLNGDWRAFWQTAWEQVAPEQEAGNHGRPRY